MSMAPEVQPVQAQPANPRGPLPKVSIDDDNYYNRLVNGEEIRHYGALAIDPEDFTFIVTDAYSSTGSEYRRKYGLDLKSLRERLNYADIIAEDIDAAINRVHDAITKGLARDMICHSEFGIARSDKLQLLVPLGIAGVRIAREAAALLLQINLMPPGDNNELQARLLEYHGIVNAEAMRIVDLVDDTFKAVEAIPDTNLPETYNDVAMLGSYCSLCKHNGDTLEECRVGLRGSWTRLGITTDLGIRIVRFCDKRIHAHTLQTAGQEGGPRIPNQLIRVRAAVFDTFLNFDWSHPFAINMQHKLWDNPFFMRDDRRDIKLFRFVAAHEWREDINKRNDRMGPGAGRFQLTESMVEDMYNGFVFGIERLGELNSEAFHFVEWEHGIADRFAIARAVSIERFPPPPKYRATQYGGPAV